MRHEHGLRNHPYYPRWLSLVQRCYNKSSRSYPTVGALGIKVADEWDRRNPFGVSNFIKWVEEEVKKKLKEDADFLKKPFVVGRHRVDQDFSPENCFLTLPVVTSQNRRNAVLDFETVVKMRQHMKKNPDTSMGGLAQLFGQTIENASRCVHGVTWANVDSTEPPIPTKRPRPKNIQQEGVPA